MRPFEVTVNGRLHRAAVSPRTSLADFLRDDIGLTGTHLGCEHGICGACTVLINGQISRSCITYAVTCAGATVETIEGLDDDPLMGELRRTFSEEHALQCGYCTPGMLITARDVLSRHTDLTQAQIRREMSGNLCRCTGYRGIVRAIARVAAQPLVSGPQQNTVGLGPAPGPGACETRSTPEAIGTPQGLATPSPTTPVPGGLPSGITVSVRDVRESDGWVTIEQVFTLPHPRTTVWPLLSDLEKTCAALPGIELDGPPVDGAVSGKASIKLGPIRPVFAFSGTYAVDDRSYSSTIEGVGTDRRSHSRAKARIQNRLFDLDEENTRVEVEIAYTIAGPLAQFGRSGFVRNLVGRLATTFAHNVNAALSGESGSAAALAQSQGWWKKWLAPLCRLIAAFNRRRPRQGD
ncbi:MAG TPA: 2Fe-2S iron-sulfur cluster binding domain-containing protein [Gammaproteobacteria bacterium]|jgi:carbon-monoxide dehydrogenase small subunit|nr:2Fe-2S iron-sulfur cluster-binding protein [Gammaproteobacteria bacterium]HBK77605.1 carbon monoxide dehydrogenase [Gammaproteobacteria bacterium]HIM87014.1 2Fe-2S iron-sulfur cluster binding domain-containing protein [Gammaproteobacteria bacterium]HIM96572.1 2Fe-2S iron-sulfur cluster binding domain-containing protein [Gammaproteobacteria bacterium]